MQSRGIWWKAGRYRSSTIWEASISPCMYRKRPLPGTVVTEGLWWLECIAGEYGVNALMSQRLTDKGNGSTLYDVAVEVQASPVAKFL